jgi:hypothetical protein
VGVGEEHLVLRTLSELFSALEPDAKGIFQVTVKPDAPELLWIRTLEGTMRADVGDYIIRGVQGEFYPCKPLIFEKTYDEMDELPDQSGLDHFFPGTQDALDALTIRSEGDPDYQTNQQLENQGLLDDDPMTEADREQWARDHAFDVDDEDEPGPNFPPLGHGGV